MSYFLEFPFAPLPNNVSSPPYVIFGINGKNLIKELPPRISLNMVLHFAPKLKQWLLPPPSLRQLPWPIAQIDLRTPHVGIDIYSEKIEPVGLKWIICRMLQVSGLTYRQDLFHLKPSIPTSISIRKTWLALDLPPAGMNLLNVHLETHLMLSRAVSLEEMRSLWENFPSTSGVVRAMGHNFIHSHIDLAYQYTDFSAIRHWYLSTDETCNFFIALENQFPDFGEVQSLISKAMTERAAKAKARKEKEEAEREKEKGKEKEEEKKKKEESKEKKEESKAKTTAAEDSDLLKVTNKSSTKAEAEKKTRPHSDGRKRIRIRRTKSIDSTSSVDTIIWNPQNPTENTPTASSEGTSDSEGSIQARQKSASTSMPVKESRQVKDKK